MEDLSSFRQRMQRTALTGALLLILFCVPLLLSAMKSSYANKVPVLSGIADNCYHSVGWIKAIWMWPVFPVFSLSDGFGVGDIFAVLYLVAVLVGVAFLSDWWSMLQRYERLRRESGDDDLRRGF